MPVLGKVAIFTRLPFASFTAEFLIHLASALNILNLMQTWGDSFDRKQEACVSGIK